MAKPRLLLSLLVLLASFASAQYLETTIDLCPVDVGSVIKLDCIAVNPATHTVYAGGDGWVAVIDGTTLTYESRIEVGGRCHALVYVPVENKLYAACRGQPDSVVCVIDCGTNQVRARLVVGVRPHALCYDPLDNKVYCANYTSNTVSVIDVSGDSVLATIPVGDQPRALCFNSVERKVYCASHRSGDVTVIDATTDTIVAVVSTGGSPLALCYNPRDNKVYCGGPSTTSFRIIDGAGDTVLATPPLNTVEGGLTYNPATDRIYSANESSIIVVDGVGDSIIDNTAKGYSWQSVLYNPASGRLYAATDDERVGVIDCVTDSLLTIFSVPDDSRRMAVDSTLNRVYGVYTSVPSVACIDGTGDSLLGPVRTGVNPVEICYNPVEDKIYTANRDNCGTVSVIDAATNSLLKTIPVGGCPWAVICDSADNRVFVSLRAGHGVDSGVVIIDCSADTIEAVVSVLDDPSYLFYYPQRGKVYCNQDRSVAVIDASTFSVRATIPVTWAAPGEMKVSINYDKVYMGDPYGNALTVIDGNGDSVRAVIPVYAQNGFGVHYCQSTEKLYCMDGGFPTSVTVIRGRDDSIIRVLEESEVCLEVWTACQNPAKTDVFMYGTAGVVVLDSRSDTVLARISVPGSDNYGDITYDLLHDRVYCCADTSVTIIDALTYRAVNTIPVGAYPSHMVWAPRHNRMFVTTSRRSSVAVIRDTSLAVSELTDVATEPLLPTMVSRSVPLRSAMQADLYDASGRRAATLKGGPNDIGRLAPGVYFVRGAQAQAVRKVVVVE